MLHLSAAEGLAQLPLFVVRSKSLHTATALSRNTIFKKKRKSQVCKGSQMAVVYAAKNSTLITTARNVMTLHFAFFLYLKIYFHFDNSAVRGVEKLHN